MDEEELAIILGPAKGLLEFQVHILAGRVCLRNHDADHTQNGSMQYLRPVVYVTAKLLF